MENFNFSKKSNVPRHFDFFPSAEMRFANAESISLAAGMPNPETFPVTAISITYKEDITKKFSLPDINTSLQYGPSQG